MRLLKTLLGLVEMLTSLMTVQPLESDLTDKVNPRKGLGLAFEEYVGADGFGFDGLLAGCFFPGGQFD